MVIDDVAHICNEKIGRDGRYESFVWLSRNTWRVANGVQELTTNAIEAHKNIHKEENKKYYKDMFYIQATLDAANFDWISHAENANEAWDILIKYFEGGDKVKVLSCNLWKDNTNCCKWIRMKLLQHMHQRFKVWFIQ